MNINQRHKLMDHGYTWEEAEELLWSEADQQLQEERDQQMCEEHERAQYAKQLEGFSRS
jgi:hypothetical protein